MAVPPTLASPSSSRDFGLGQRYSDIPAQSIPTSAPDPHDSVSHHAEDQGEEDEYGSGEDLPLFPNTHTATLKHHKKVVSAIAIDPSGARFASGAHDYDVKLWDFGGMGAGVGRPFKSFEPAENYYVRTVSHRTTRLQYFLHFMFDSQLFLSGGAAQLCLPADDLSNKGGREELVIAASSRNMS